MTRARAAVVIAVTGSAGSGKSTVSDMLGRGLSAAVVRLGGAVSSEVARRGIGVGERSESAVRHELRRLYGDDAIARMVADEIVDQLGGGRDVVVDGVRNSAELIFLELATRRESLLVTVICDEGLRRDRVQKRETRPLSALDLKSRDTDEDMLGMGNVAEGSHLIVNNGTLEELASRSADIVAWINRGTEGHRGSTRFVV